MRKVIIIILLTVSLIPKTASTQIITTFAGTLGTSGYSGDWGAATAAKISNLLNLVIDTAGNVFIGDGGNHVIRKVSTSGIITTYAGNGIEGYTGDGGPATDAQMNPSGGWGIDKHGNIYVSDATNKIVRKISATTGIISTFAGNGSSTASGDGGPATIAGLATPSGICADTAGNIYIAAGFFIRKVSPSGIITSIAGTGISGNDGDGGLAIAGKIGAVTYLAIDIAGNIYFANGGLGDGTIRKINTSGIISRIGGTIAQGYSGDFGPATAAQFRLPRGLCIDSCGNIYVGDVANNVIRIISAGTGNVYTIMGTGTAGTSGDGGPATAAQFSGLGCIVMDRENKLYITSDTRVRKVQMPSCADIVFPVSLGEVTSKEKNSIDIHPNPNDGAFILKVSTGGRAPVHVAMVTMVGATVQEYIVQPGKETTLKPYLPPGIYMVVALSEKGRLVKKVVVR